MNNTAKLIVKIAVAVAAVAGAIFLIATYGSRITAWAKKLLGKKECNCEGECTCDGECTCEAEEAVEEIAEEAAEEAPAEEGAVVAEEMDFEG